MNAAPSSRALLGALALASLTATADAQLVHQYRFDGMGTTLVDEVGSADGQILGGAALAGTGSLEFDGIDDYVELPPGILGTQLSATFEVWYTWDDGAFPNWQRIMDFGNSDAGQGSSGAGLTYFALTPQSSDSGTPTAAIRLVPTANSRKGLATSAPGLGVETHLAVSFSGGDTFKLYMNGVLQDETGIANDLSAIIDENNWLGRSQWVGDPWFLGSISEFRIYDAALSDADIAMSFAAGPDGGSVGVNYCGPAVVNSSGAVGTMSATGSDVAAINSLSLAASGIPRNSFAFFLASTAQGVVNQPGGSSGVLCLSGAIGRYVGAGQIQQAGQSGEIGLTLDLTQIPQPNGFVSAMAGDTWSFQAWYRDSSPTGPTSNFTDGLEVTFL